MGNTEVFALDIGTRKIAGLIMTRTETGFKIKHASLHQQLPNAMADGQIHQIDAVAKVIKTIKAELEAAGEKPLTEAAVAAAGRSLLTQEGRSTKKLPPAHRLSPEEVQALELEAVANAIEQLSAVQGGGVMDSYLCVGYSVVQYYLDGAPIGSLVNHQGNEGKVEIIATFLPRIVIDSLGTALDAAGLKMQSLTLEPIAAMHLVVPATMRMLNIALVDVGAGTSDLAVAAEGTIRGYGMVSYAGDAITAGIAEHYLLDKTVAEQVKLQITPGQSVTCTDVFGNQLSLTYDEILAVIYPKIEVLAEKIGEEIIRLNGTAPKGIILVGGGSLTPKLPELLAKQLELPQNLVRMRDRISLEKIQGQPEFSGPEVITPIGIGCTHLDQGAMQLIRVRVNNQQLQFLKMASSTIGDALLHAGLNPVDFLGRPGPAFTVELNGRYIPLPGTLGKPSVIFQNGQTAELNAPLADGDEIKVEPGTPGESPRLTVGELTEAKTSYYQLTLNGAPVEIKPEILVNGQRAALDYLIQDRDKIVYKPITTVLDLFAYLQIPLKQEVEFVFNGQSKLVEEPIEVLINGEKKPLTTPLTSGLNLKYFRKQNTIRALVGGEGEQKPGISIKVNGTTVQLRPKKAVPIANGQEVSLDYVIRPRDRIQYEPWQPGTYNSYIVTDVFLDYEPEAAFLAKGGLILVNGKEAGFTTPLKEGDVLEFRPYGAETANS